jgi:hypothetical protein
MKSVDGFKILHPVQKNIAPIKSAAWHDFLFLIKISNHDSVCVVDTRVAESRSIKVGRISVRLIGMWRIRDSNMT